jgi:hypothetical protein
MKSILLFVFISFTITFSAQTDENLTAEERAYLFHIVKKSPILEMNMGRYFDYKGPQILFPNKSINFDSIESLIINKPEILIIRKEEIAKSEKGLIGEAANKMAVWELNKILLAKREGEKELEPFQTKYEVFENILIKNLPPSALKSKDGLVLPNKKIFNLLDPSLSFDDKNAFIGSFHFLNQTEKIVTLKAINNTINEYVEKRTFEIFIALGGRGEVFKNVLVAAGDGSSTTGILEEREKDEKGRWNKGLPKAIGLFPYQIEFVLDADGKNKKIEPARFAILDFETVGNNKMTNLHFDVWGYNSKKQTTVVIEKNGLSYPLFGSGQTRFLSPDSTFSDGATFQTLINDLEFNRIGKLKEMIYGKKGFDYWIEYNEKKKDQTELKIIKHEKSFSDLGYTPVVTKNKMSRKTKKLKKYANPNKQIDYQPITKSNKKQKKQEQNEIVGLYKLFDDYKAQIKVLKQQKQEAMDLMAIQDSSTFDMYTQEFRFKESTQPEHFEVRLLAIPESCLSSEADEVMLHVSLIDAIPHYNSRIQLEMNDLFLSDKWDLSQTLFNDEDSVSVRQFFETLLDENMNFTLTANGYGVGEWDGAQVIKSAHPKEEMVYKGSKMDSVYLRLRKSELFVTLDREIKVEVNSYTDPIISNLQIDKQEILDFQSKNKLSKNDILSVYRTATILRKMKAELNLLAGKYLTREEAKIVIDRLNKEIDQTRINVGSTEIKLSDI